MIEGGNINHPRYQIAIDDIINAALGSGGFIRDLELEAEFEQEAGLLCCRDISTRRSLFLACLLLSQAFSLLNFHGVSLMPLNEMQAQQSKVVIARMTACAQCA